MLCFGCRLTFSPTEEVGWGGLGENTHREEDSRTRVKKESNSLSIVDSHGFPPNAAHFWKNVSKLFIALSPSLSAIISNSCHCVLLIKIRDGDCFVRLFFP